ncbi:MAG: TrkA family potassium uptake protein [Planctomycetes bacterium]|nr:TrkA family potassium uptake protein [Planctomycetota bacterium]
MRYAVVGLGEFGKALALKLSRRGGEVIAVDKNLDFVDSIKNDVAIAVKADVTNENDLKSQGIDKVDILIAAIEDNFELNELVVVIAKKLGVKKVIARATDSIRATILKVIGADEVIQPDESAAESLAQRLLFPSVRNYNELFEGCSIAEILIPESLVGQKLSDLNLPNRYGINVITIIRKSNMPYYDNKMSFIPTGSDVLRPGDIIVIAGANENISNLLSSV